MSTDPVTLVWRTDVHASDKGPSSRLDSDQWLDVVSDKLLQVAQIARQENALAVIDGGDFFDKKSPSRNSHRLVRKIAEVHRQYPCPVYANVGNHDCVHGDIRFLPQQPLEVLFATGVFNRLYDAHEVTFTRGGATVRVVGVPYHGTSYDLSRLAVKKGDEDYLVVAAHLLASRSGGAMFDGEDIVPYSKLEGLDADIFAFGHWHKDQGVREIADGKWVVNVGSLTRGSLSEDNIDRQPACAVFRFPPEGVQIEVRRLHITPAREVFDFKARAKKEVKTKREEEFAERISALIERSDNKVSLFEVLSSMTAGDLGEEEGEVIPAEVREKARLYLERAGLGKEAGE